MNEIIESFKVKLNNQLNIPIEGILNNSNEKFGILTMKMKSTKLITKPVFLTFTLDITGSMGEQGGATDPSKSKLDNLKSTMCSLVKYLALCGSPIFIKINTFNTNCITIQETIRVTEDNFHNVILKINGIYPDGATDIGKALTKAVEDINIYRTSNDNNNEHIIGHIFLSDGEPSAGEHNFDILASLFDTSYPNVFLGFGVSHNAALFQLFASKSLAEYRFIDNCELSSLIYGEILNKFLHPAVSNAKITISNGEIYNFKTNEWTTTISEDDIATEIERVYHIKTSTPDLLSIDIRGKVTGIPDDSMDDYDSLDNEIKLLATTSLPHELLDLVKYIFRQRVQELLYRAKEFNKKRNYDQNNDEKKELIKDMKELFKKMKDYMTENGLNDDSFFTLLCDDIHITYTTMDTPMASMFSTSRYYGQGKQLSYCSASPQQISIPQLQHSTFTFGSPTLFNCAPSTPKRQGVRFGFGGQLPINQTTTGGNDELDMYTPSKVSNTTCYSTPSVVKTMSALSNKNDI